MTSDQLIQFFDDHRDEYLEFKNVKNPKHTVHDICAFLILHDIVETACCIIGGADHDVVYLSHDVNEVAEKATEAQLLDLIRCGVRYDSQADCFAMFT